MTSCGGTVALLAFSLLAALDARAEPPPPRIGVLTDMGGPYADAGGVGSVAAARLAVEHLGASVCWATCGRR